MKDFVDEPLKGLRGVAQPEGHTDILKEAEGGGDCRLRYIRRFYWDVVIRLHQVYLAVDRCAIQVLCEVVDMRQWVPIGLCLIVQRSVVPTRPPVSRIFLGDHVEGCGPGTL